MEQEKLIQTLQECAELIKVESNLFNYASVDFPTCDTPGCIAGWIAAIAVSRGDATIDEIGMFSLGDNDFGSCLSVASEYLGLSEKEEWDLFYGLFTYVDGDREGECVDSDPTKEDAIKYIDRFIRYIKRGRMPEDLEVFSNAQVHLD